MCSSSASVSTSAGLEVLMCVAFLIFFFIFLCFAEAVNHLAAYMRIVLRHMQTYVLYMHVYVCAYIHTCSWFENQMGDLRSTLGIYVTL